MAKDLKEMKLEIGTRFKKGDVIITLVDVKRKEAIFHRAYKGTRRLFETVGIKHLLSCTSIYQRIEEGI